MDGSEDDQLTPFLKSKKLLNKQEQSLVVTEDDLKRFMSLAPQTQKSPMARIFRVLCCDAVGMKTCTSGPKEKVTRATTGNSCV